MEIAHKPTAEYGVREIFLAWDLDGNGFIDKQEFANCCAELNMTRQQLDTIFTELDRDGDERISLTEFSDGFQRVCSLFSLEADDVLNKKSFDKLLDGVGVRGLLSG